MSEPTQVEKDALYATALERIATLTKMLRYVAFVASGVEAADPQLAVDQLKTERDEAKRDLLFVTTQTVLLMEAAGCYTVGDSIARIKEQREALEVAASKAQGYEIALLNLKSMLARVEHERDDLEARIANALA